MRTGRIVLIGLLILLAPAVRAQSPMPKKNAAGNRSELIPTNPIIPILIPPSCSLSVTPTTLQAGQSLTATASCTATANDTLNVNFNLGNGVETFFSRSTNGSGDLEVTFPYSYDRFSIYFISATVTDTTINLAGTVSPASVLIVVLAAPPICSMSVTPTTLQSGQSVTASFGCTPSNSGDMLDIAIDWGDGTANSGEFANNSGLSGLTLAHTYGQYSIYTINATVTDATANLAGTVNPASVAITVSSPPLLFVPVTPCRIADTRGKSGPFGGPTPSSGSTRSFTIPSSACGIPSTAAAYSLNVTAVPQGPLSWLTMWPTGQTEPVVSTLNSPDGRIKANAAIVPAGTGGAVSVFVTNTTDVILDINGYFVPISSTTSGALAFYPVTPCRLVDTRSFSNPLAGPTMSAGQTRTFPLLAGSCSVPSTAQAYSLNFTVVPQGSLSWLTAWPAGETEPVVSTLNAPTGAITANAAIVPAGSGGSIDAFVTNNTDLIIDINGYFAPMGSGSLVFYPVIPCRVLDTRGPSNNVPPFSGTISVNVPGSGCLGSATAQAYVLNTTVVPPGALSYMALWPQGTTQPVVSTLNAADGAITANMAIVPTTNGSISDFATNPTQLILDISGYFGYPPD